LPRLLDKPQILVVIHKYNAPQEKLIDGTFVAQILPPSGANHDKDMSTASARWQASSAGRED